MKRKRHSAEQVVARLREAAELLTRATEKRPRDDAAWTGLEMA